MLAWRFKNEHERAASIKTSKEMKEIRDLWSDLGDANAAIFDTIEEMNRQHSVSEHLNVAMMFSVVVVVVVVVVTIIAFDPQIMSCRGIHSSSTRTWPGRRSARPPSGKPTQ